MRHSPDSSDNKLSYQLYTCHIFFSPSLEEGRRLLRGRNGEVDTKSEISFAAEVETMTKDEVKFTFGFPSFIYARMIARVHMIGCARVCMSVFACVLSILRACLLALTDLCALGYIFPCPIPSDDGSFA